MAVDLFGSHVYDSLNVLYHASLWSRVHAHNITHEGTLVLRLYVYVLRSKSLKSEVRCKCASSEICVNDRVLDGALQFKAEEYGPAQCHTWPVNK